MFDAQRVIPAQAGSSRSPSASTRIRQPKPGPLPSRQPRHAVLPHASLSLPSADAPKAVPPARRVAQGWMDPNSFQTAGLPVATHTTPSLPPATGLQ